MFKKTLMFFVAAMACLALVAGADDATKEKEAHGDMHKDEPKTMTLMGEIVDTACYIAHGAKGEKHAACAAKCIKGGAPMGLLTADGTVWILMPNHDDADAFNALKDMAAMTVSVTGSTMERGGIKAIDVTGYKAAADPKMKEKSKK